MKLSTEESSSASTDRPGGRKKIKSLRKTFTNIFHFKHPPSRDPTAQHEQSGGDKRSSSTSLFKIPTKRNKSVPPGKRALPPVPAATAAPVESRTPSPQSELSLRLDGDQGGGVPPPLEPRPPLPTETAASEEDSQMDFALSIQKVKDVSVIFF